MTKPLEQALNDFYVNAWAIVEDLTLADQIQEDNSILSQVEKFVRDIRESYDTLQRVGYVAAWPHLEEASAGFIGLCRYKIEHLPNLDQDLPQKCSEDYRALPDPVEEGLKEVPVDTKKVFERNVLKMERAYKGQGDLGGQSLEKKGGM